MECEYDLAKSEANLAKHGIDFVEAQLLWDVWGFERQLPFTGEPRFERVQLLDGRYWTAIFTLRGVAVRLISVRRSRKVEIEDHGRASRNQSQHDNQP